MTGFTRERPLAIRTDGGGSVRGREARRGDERLGRRACRSCRRSLVVVSSDIVATAPIPDRLARDRLDRRRGRSPTRSMMVDYYRTTRDGRIAFGKGTAGLSYRGRVGPASTAAPGARDGRRRVPPRLPKPRRCRDRAGLGGTDRPDPNSIPILGHLGGREHILLRSRLERQRRRAERRRRQGAREPRHSAAATSGPRHG